MAYPLMQRYERLPMRSSWSITLLMVILATLLASCDLVRPASVTPPGEDEVQTRVAATLTALATAAPPSVPSPTYTATRTSVPPSPTTTPTETMPPPTATQPAPTPMSTVTQASPSSTPTTTPTTPPPTPTRTPVPQPTVTPIPTTTPTSIPTSTPTPTIANWRGEYYGNRDLAGAPAVVRDDAAVDFDWGQGSPATALPVDNFAACWTRSVSFEGASYRFQIFVDDGVRLWLDDELIIDAWHDSSPHTITVLHPVTKGVHIIRVEYYEHGGEALVHLWWEKVNLYADWKGEYWSNRGLFGHPTLIRSDQDVDFDWGSSAPASGLPVDNFSARWTRTAEFDSATYRFHVFVDDGVRLWIDDRLVIDAWYDHKAHQVTADHSLSEGEHRLRVEYYEHTDGARIQLWWERVAPASYPDWKGEYWSNPDLNGDPALVRNDQEIDFYWDLNGAAPGLPADDFAVRWSRQMSFKTGIYRFSAWFDDGIRFYIDGDLILDEWHDGQRDELYTPNLTLTGEHHLVVEYYDRAGKAWIKFRWQRIQSGPEAD